MPFPFCWSLSSFSVSAAAVLVPVCTVCGASGRAAAALVWGSLIIDSASAASGQNPKRKLKNTKNKNNLQYAFFLLWSSCGRFGGIGNDNGATGMWLH